MTKTATGPDSVVSKGARKKKALPVGHYRGLGLWNIVFMIFLYAPIAVLIIYSFNANRMVINWTGFGLEWYVKAFHNEDIQDAVWNSLVVAFVATGVATTIATIGALILARGGNFWGKTASLGLMMLPLMVPEIVTAVAVLIFFASIGLNWGLGNVIIAHITFCIPFAFMPIRARLEGMDTTLEQAARAALLDAAFACAPRAALAPRCTGAFAAEAVAFVDASGIGSLFRSESGFASALTARARKLGLPADATVASSRSVARVAARHLQSRPDADPGGRVLALSAESELEFLSPLPIDLLDPILDDLLKFGRVDQPPRPWLGLFAAEAEGFLVVAGTTDDGPADDAGIQVGDARFYDRIEEELGRIAVGDAVQVLVLREGKKKLLGASFAREAE